MPVEHVKADADAARVTELLQRDGCCIVDRLVEPAALSRVLEELEPWMSRTASGPDDFSGRHTRRIGGLIARSPASHPLVEHPLVLGAARGLLHDATSLHVHLTQVIAIGPGETAQPVHRDQWAFDFFPFPTGYEAQCNTIWAVTDFTEENGATRVIPGSHRREDKLRFAHEDTEPAEMEAGSVLLYTGALYHGGGANRSDSVRCGLNLTYARSWLRQEENQYLSVPLEVARTLPESLQKLIGYARGAYALGYVDDLRDPLEVLRPEKGRTGFGDRLLGDSSGGDA
ncbi:MAG: phytanoyl-CoA dioxygenase family protein [Deltaproteobacteria bacterium]|nr:phytanoyl-CoA dioxygenase family protein [Deltaproteobacteria bacterium]MBW2416313.1 phytanoyl-CoA dioxygenase family protein [Deltaproteobacteria bacterium]